MSNDEIREAAEEYIASCECPVRPDYFTLRQYVEHAIIQDRARRDSLESMLVELAGYNLNPGFKRLWYCSRGELYSLLFNHHQSAMNGYYDTPTEAARAALDELKGGKSNDQ